MYSIILLQRLKFSAYWENKQQVHAYIASVQFLLSGYMVNFSQSDHDFRLKF